MDEFVAYNLYSYHVWFDADTQAIDACCRWQLTIQRRAQQGAVDKTHVALVTHHVTSTDASASGLFAV